MANFGPLKSHILSVLDEFIRCYDLCDPFLDIGCGRGDVALHLAKQGWRGKAIDTSPSAIEIARVSLREYSSIRVACQSLDDHQSEFFNTVLMFDVLEHIPNDQAALEAVATTQSPGGALVLVVPSNPEREWRWDDQAYGHVRRYRPSNIPSLLAASGYDTVEVRDITFPIFWLLRRGYTAIKSPAPQASENSWALTQQSSLTNAWDMGLVSRVMSNELMWRPLLALQRRIRARADRGHEMMVLARRVK